MYNLIRKFLFFFNPETAHKITFSLLKFFSKIPGTKNILKKIYYVESDEVVIAGLTFPGRVGLAAGLDKDSEVFDMLGYLGFDFIETGTVTPKAQPGNDKPRIFRLKKDKALINRMGFNNKGVEFTIRNLKKKKSDILIGGNIGKNKITLNENAIEDYKKSYLALYNFVDYFVVNVSSPNTPNLRELQDEKPLTEILLSLNEIRSSQKIRKPLFLKIAPDLSFEQIDKIIEIVKKTNTDGIVATNTTISREKISITKKEIEEIGNGGLSGKPLRKKSTEIIKYISDKTLNKIPIIGVGGIMSPQDAIEKLKAGAWLIQIYTGFIYEGPRLINRIKKEIKKFESEK